MPRLRRWGSRGREQNVRLTRSFGQMFVSGAKGHDDGSSNAGFEVWDARAAEESGVCGGGNTGAGAGDWRKQGDIQRGERGAAASAPAAGAGAADAGVACAAGKKVSGRDAVLPLAGELSGLAEAKSRVRENGGARAVGDEFDGRRAAGVVDGGGGDGGFFLGDESRADTGAHVCCGRGSAGARQGGGARQGILAKPFRVDQKCAGAKADAGWRCLHGDRRYAADI